MNSRPIYLYEQKNNVIKKKKEKSSNKSIYTIEKYTEQNKTKKWNKIIINLFCSQFVRETIE